MRLSRWLILAALLAIVAFVGQTYIKRQQALARDAPPAPPPLETGINGRASDWVYTQSDGERPRVTIRAKSFRQVQAPSVMELEGVELQLFHQEGDAVRSGPQRQSAVRHRRQDALLRWRRGHHHADGEQGRLHR